MYVKVRVLRSGGFLMHSSQEMPEQKKTTENKEGK
jgi:hypothetical protein